MKNILSFCLLCLLLNFSIDNSWAASELVLNKAQGRSNFLALGNPSAIRINGTGEGPDGRLNLQEQGPNVQISGQLLVDLKTYETGIGLRDRHMKEKYLEVGKFEKAALTVKEILLPKLALLQEAPTKIDFTGTLDLHGVQKPVQGEIIVKNNAGKLKIDANFKLKLSDYSIHVPTFAGITVADTVEISTSSEVERTP